jgi:hypothetical protein
MKRKSTLGTVRKVASGKPDELTICVATYYIPVKPQPPAVKRGLLNYLGKPKKPAAKPSAPQTIVRKEFATGRFIGGRHGGKHGASAFVWPDDDPPSPDDESGKP